MANLVGFGSVSADQWLVALQAWDKADTDEEVSAFVSPERRKMVYICMVRDGLAGIRLVAAPEGKEPSYAQRLTMDKCVQFSEQILESLSTEDQFATFRVTLGRMQLQTEGTLRSHIQQVIENAEKKEAALRGPKQEVADPQESDSEEDFPPTQPYPDPASNPDEF